LLANTKLVADFPHFLGTPSFFVNGKLITTGYSVETISKVIDEALKNSVSN
jgi:protein-disulfide isomerase